jgi:hypothetical protein
VETREIHETFDRLEQEDDSRYHHFVDCGEEFIHVLEDGVPDSEDRWIGAEQILENSGIERKSFRQTNNRKFKGVYNLMCREGILPAFHSSPPYEIDSEGYDSKPVVEAWEYASGEEFEEQESGPEKVQPPPHDTDDLYDELTE